MKPYQHQSHYELLEVPVTAGAEELRAAYDRLQAMYAPDSVALYTLADPSEADALRARLGEAYRVLADPAARAAYDEQRRAVAAATPHAPARPTPAPRPSVKARKGRAGRISGAASSVPPAPPTPVPPPSPAPAVASSWSATSYSFTWVTPSPASTPSWQISLPGSARVASSPAPPAPVETEPPPERRVASPVPRGPGALDSDVTVAAGAAPSSAAPAWPAAAVAPPTSAVVAPPTSAVVAPPTSAVIDPAPAVLVPAVAPAHGSATGSSAAETTTSASTAPSRSAATLDSPVVALPAADVSPDGPGEVRASAPVVAAPASVAPGGAHPGLPAPAPERLPVEPEPWTVAPAPPPRAVRPVVSSPEDLPLFASQGTPARPAPVRGLPSVSPADHVRAIPPWPITDETLLEGSEDEEPITDTHAVPEERTPKQADGEPEEIDPDELLELEPEPPVDSAGEPVVPVQETLSFDPAAPPSAPPPLPRLVERTITPVQFQVSAAPARVPAASPPAESAEPPLPEKALPRTAPMVSQLAPAAPAPVAPPPPPESAAIILAPKRAEPIRLRALEIPPDAVFNGEFLKKIRQARELTLEEISARTRIARKTLENVEADRYAELPAHVYLRGTLMSFATSLGLDPIRVSRGYMDLVQAARPPRR